MPTRPVPQPGTWSYTVTPGAPAPRLPDRALDIAVRMRGEGLTNAAILHRLTAAGWETTGYDPGLLNHHVRGRMRALGMPLPTRRRRAAAAGGLRRFGVEIECKGLTADRAAAALSAAGFRARSESWNHATRTWWKVTTDGSLSGTACEVVSPPMTDVAEVSRVMTVLREAGARVDVQCGLHVHHEATDLSNEALDRLLRMYEACRRTDLDALVARSRRVGSHEGDRWCARRSDRDIERVAEALRAAPTPATSHTDRVAQLQAALRYAVGGDRYRALNLVPLQTYGTVEFRQHQGTLSGAKVEAWIALGRAMVDAAVADTTVRPGRLVDDLQAAGHLPTETADYLTRRAQRLAA